MQSDRDFLFLGFGESSVSLYQGNLNSMNYIDTVIFPEARKVMRDKKEIDSWNVLKTKRIISFGAVEWLDLLFWQFYKRKQLVLMMVC